MRVSLNGHKRITIYKWNKNNGCQESLNFAGCDNGEMGLPESNRYCRMSFDVNPIRVAGIQKNPYWALFQPDSYQFT